jgi:ribonuclease Z
MVWNVTQDEVRVRLAVVDHETWAPPLASPAQLPSSDDIRDFAERTGLCRRNRRFGQPLMPRVARGIRRTAAGVPR